jgi:protein-S-isoprenylcysteine O-methyltransferase Ste14
MLLLLRSIVWTIVVPGTVTVYIPYLIVTRWRPTVFQGWEVPQFLALIPMGVGAAILLHCIWLFAWVGRGTLAPVDAPRRLVIQGLYRYLRNPMYVGVLLILLGEAFFFSSMAILEYAVGWFVVINLVVLLYEEPILRHQFGESYERYCRAVRRWWPGGPYNPAA